MSCLKALTFKIAGVHSPLERSVKSAYEQSQSYSVIVTIVWDLMLKALSVSHPYSTVR